MCGFRTVFAGGVAFCAVLACLALAQGPALAQQPSFWAPPTGISASWPKLLPIAGGPQQATLPVWPEQEISLAKARCTALLQGLNVVAVPAPPIREGDCGTPAPMELISIGKSPQVAFSPTVIVTCDMVAALHKWVAQALQPLARRHLGAPLIRIDTMSSYSCRNAYGRTANRLSEHGRANAIDIRGFITAKAEFTDVLADWGPTAHEIDTQVAAAKASNQPEQVGRTAIPAGRATDGLFATYPLRPGTHELGDTPRSTATSATPSLLPTESGSFAAPTVLPLLSVGAVGIPTLTLGGFGQPSHLGGPNPADVPDARADARTSFLRDAHSAACRIFGTVLGPEANTAHRNHFHVDMAERATFCE
jgi:hypothetical protein